jgi:hypothetical protein
MNISKSVKGSVIAVAMVATSMTATAPAHAYSFGDIFGGFGDIFSTIWSYVDNFVYNMGVYGGWNQPIVDRVDQYGTPTVSRQDELNGWYGSHFAQTDYNPPSSTSACGYANQYCQSGSSNY